MFGANSAFFFTALALGNCLALYFELLPPLGITLVQMGVLLFFHSLTMVSREGNVVYYNEVPVTGPLMMFEVSHAVNRLAEVS